MTNAVGSRDTCHKCSARQFNEDLFTVKVQRPVFYNEGTTRIRRRRISETEESKSRTQEDMNGYFFTGHDDIIWVFCDFHVKLKQQMHHVIIVQVKKSEIRQKGGLTEDWCCTGIT